MEHKDIPYLAKSLGQTEEEAGRNARYKFFKSIIKKHNIDYIATAHNKDDRAETVLMRIIRGSGLMGLRGIKYKREDNVIRPLLDVSREMIEGYCRENNLDYMTDSTNNDDDYMRNKVRHKLIPIIKELNPKAIDALSNLSKNVSDDADFLDDYAERLYARLNPPLFNNRFKALDIKTLKMIESRSILSRLILRCAKDAMGNSYTLEKKHIEMIIEFLYAEGEGNPSINMPGELVIYKRNGWMEFRLSQEKYEKNIADNIPKFDNTNAEELNLYNNTDFCIEVKLDKLYNIKSDCECYATSISVVPKSRLSIKKNDILLDYDLIINETGSDKLYLRNRKSGDRMVVYKNGNTKKLKSIFIDQKIRREERDKIPVLTDSEDNILAALGVRISEKYKINKDTKNILVVHLNKY